MLMFKKKRKEEEARELDQLDQLVEADASEKSEESEVSEKSEESENSEHSENSENSDQLVEPAGPEPSPFEELLRDWQERMEITDEKAGTLLSLMRKSEAMLKGEEPLDRETMEILLKGVDYDADVEKAMAEGEIRGRNAVIVEEFRDLRAEQKDDGIPRLGGSPGMSSAKRSNTIFDLARDARQNYYPL